ncbi:MAG: sugar phosphate isomerase/epimerase [Anaerolineaceae bacterium]|nr:sugar phosphate isomerase/epimerase [Anaerolineaceae bacterium]
MILAFHGATTKTSSLETDVMISAQAGYQALEVWAEKIDVYLATHSLTQLNALFVDQHVLPLTINSIEFVAFQGNEFHKIEAQLHKLGKIAQAIGCATIVIVASPLPGRTITWEAVKEEYVRVLQSLSQIAKLYEIKLTFEFLGFGWCSVRTPRAAYEILQAADCDNIGLTLDAAHFYNGGGLLSEIEQLDPRRIFAFHLNDVEDTPKEAISDATRLFPGEGVIPLDEICARLKQIRYDGPTSIEIFRPEYWAWEPLRVAVEARKAAMRVLGRYFDIDQG